MQLREGFCNYCKEGKMVEVPDDATQKKINEEVTEQCRCTMASRIRERRNQKETCIANINEMLAEIIRLLQKYSWIILMLSRITKSRK